MSGHSEPEREATNNVVLVDGSNVAYAIEGEPPRVANIVADAALRHSIDDPRRYEHLIDEGHVRQSPAGTDADYFILSFARELNASIVSNDRFRDRIKQFPDAQDRVIRFMIVQDEVVLERRTRRRDDE
jgi:hypothetical protein